MQLTLIIAAVSAVLSGLAGFALAWQLQAGTITQKELDHANERAAVNDSIRLALEANTRQITQAQNAAAARGVRNRTAAAGAAAAGNGLRIATTAAVQAAAQDPSACFDTATALSAVLTASADAYRDLAEVCDRHVSDIQTLTDTWPQPPGATP